MYSGIQTPRSGFQTPRGAGGPQGPGNMGQKYPSMQSVHSLLSQGYLPPGHGYVPKPIKPDKPYGPTFITVMNRTWRGPGKKYLQYALVTWCICILFLCATGLYWGHRNVSRMIVLRTEYFGAIFCVIFICLFGLTFHFIHKARIESNRWRSYVRFRSEGLYKVVAYNDKYDPEDRTPMETGTYGKRALKEIPKPGRRKRPRKGASRGASGMNTPGGMYEPRGAGPKPMPILEEQEDPPTPNYPPPPPNMQQGATGGNGNGKPRYEWPGMGGQQYAPPPQQRGHYGGPPPPAQPQYGAPRPPMGGAGQFSAPIDPRMDPRRYGAEQTYPVRGMGSVGDSET